MIKDIPGYEGVYKITSNGEVFAENRIVKMPKGGTRIIKAHSPHFQEDKKGYYRVWLTSKNGVRTLHRVHRLVLLTFIGKSELQCNHKDMNKKNNSVENLEYVTNRENTIHRIDKSKTTSRFTGVTRIKSGKFQAHKKINGKATYLGVFVTEEEAYQKYINTN